MIAYSINIGRNQDLIGQFLEGEEETVKLIER